MKLVKTILLVCMSLSSNFSMAQSDSKDLPENWREDTLIFSIVSNSSLSGSVTEFGAELVRLELRGEYTVTTRDKYNNVVYGSELLSNRDPKTPAVGLIFAVKTSSEALKLNECVKLATDAIITDLNPNKIHMTVKTSYLANTDAPAEFTCGVYIQQ
ncbi:MAG: hypothetical protein KBD78_01515 [Oligoflexales bacterium]|nr:hypothetical protein [Oligoflexales bacterium]